MKKKTVIKFIQVLICQIVIGLFFVNGVSMPMFIIIKQNFNFSLMRLQFPLKKVKISPVCHIQINRHAEEMRGRYAIGLLYGCLFDDEAHVTSILPYPDAENLAKEQLEAIERRHEDMLIKFNMDSANVGWYMVSYKQNVWQQLQNAKYYQKSINNSFMLVYDYESRQVGKNPYNVYRLTDQFALKEQFSYAQIAYDSTKSQFVSPFTQIPAQVQKDEIFESLFLLNKKKLLTSFKTNNKQKESKDKLSQKIESYMQTLQTQSELNRKIMKRQSLGKQSSTSTNNVSFNQYCENVGVRLKAEDQEKQLRNYEKNIGLTRQLLGV